jgi:hypothetical protein
MSTERSAWAVNEDLLRIFGMAGERMVTGMRIEVSGGELPKLIIEKCITAGELDQLTTLVEVHRLQPVLESSEQRKA